MHVGLDMYRVKSWERKEEKGSKKLLDAPFSLRD
jgi:hypothetical protein